METIKRILLKMPVELLVDEIYRLTSEIGELEIENKELKKQLHIGGVSQQRELLDAFCCTLEFDVKHETYEEDINYFLENVKADNCG